LAGTHILPLESYKYPLAVSFTMLLELVFGLASSQHVRAPSGFEKLVSSHVDVILETGYAECLSSEDLFHGHLILRRPQGSCYSGLNELESSVELVLYHTAEHTDRWRSESEAGSEHVPRSLVGFRDGSVAKAIDLVKYEKLFSKATYDLFGTVYSDDLMAGKEYLHDGSKKVDVTCVMIDGLSEDLSFQFLITPQKQVYFPKR